MATAYEPGRWEWERRDPAEIGLDPERIAEAVNFSAANENPSMPYRLSEFYEQRVAEDPGDEGEPLLAADRAHLFRGLTVESGGPEQVRPRITDLLDGDATGVDVGEQRTALQRVVHHLTLGTHPGQGTRTGAHPRPARPRALRPTG